MNRNFLLYVREKKCKGTGPTQRAKDHFASLEAAELELIPESVQKEKKKVILTI